MPYKKSADLEYSVAPVSPVAFRRLLLLAVVGFFTVLVTDYSSGLLSKFDAYGFPLCVFSYSVIYVLSATNKADHKTLLMFSYFTLTIYLISISLYQHLFADLRFSNSLQWLAINYIVAYLYLEVRYVTSIVVVIYLLTVASHFIAIIQNYSVTHSAGVTVNIAIAHAICIGLLSSATRLRLKTDKTEERANTLENIAYVDLLTRILNRRGIEKVITELNIDTTKPQFGYAFLMIDIDHFKLINDKHGHLVGDTVLHRIASKLSRSIHPNDLIGRWGGEEFIVVTQNRNLQQTTDLAETLRGAISELKIEGMPNITVSIGVAHSSETISRESLLKIADENLYTAKHSGRNKVCNTQSALIP